jgi:hypothetical protein
MLTQAPIGEAEVSGDLFGVFIVELDRSKFTASVGLLHHGETDLGPDNVHDLSQRWAAAAIEGRDTTVDPRSRPLDLLVRGKPGLRHLTAPGNVVTTAYHHAKAWLS